MPRPDAAHATAVQAWFGNAFGELHPALQALHRDGGVLRGEVGIVTGRALGGWLGRRVARRLGVPLGRARRGFEVRIEHDAKAMRWTRRFDDGSVLVSVFEPMGRYPHGEWRERNGAVTLRLGVDTDGGGWRWRLRGVSLRGIPLPRWPLRMQAWKRIERDGGYRFCVAFALAGGGLLLRYEGVLRVEADTPAKIAP